MGPLTPSTVTSSIFASCCTQRASNRGGSSEPQMWQWGASKISSRVSLSIFLAFKGSSLLKQIPKVLGQSSVKPGEGLGGTGQKMSTVKTAWLAPTAAQQCHNWDHRGIKANVSSEPNMTYKTSVDVLSARSSSLSQFGNSFGATQKLPLLSYPRTCSFWVKPTPFVPNL